MDFLKSLFTRKKPLSSNVRNNTARGNYEFNQGNRGNTNFSNVNPALRNLKIKRAVNAYEKTRRSQLNGFKKAYNTLSTVPTLSNSNMNVVNKLINQRNRAVRTVEKLGAVGRSYPEDLATLKGLQFEQFLRNRTNSGATNDPRKLSGASNQSAGRRKTRRRSKSRRRN